MRTNVCLTGIGLITSLGSGNDVVWDALISGKSGIKNIKIFDFDVDPEQTTLSVAAPMDFSNMDDPRKTTPEGMYEGDYLLCKTADMAKEDAQIDEFPANTAVFIGAGASSSLNIEEFEKQIYDDLQAGKGNITKMPLNMTSSDKVLSNYYNLYGPKMMFATACSSSGIAMGYAFDMISNGTCDVAIVGAADTLCQLTHSGFHGLRSIDPERCKPFDANRSGITIGEASVVCILESESSAQKRGKTPYCYMSGYALNCDAGRMTSPDESGKVYSDLMISALADAGYQPEDIDYICAHGTATRLNDVTESKAINTVFGERAPLVSSVKGALGHCMAGAGVVNCAMSALAIKNSSIPANIGMVDQDEECVIPIATQSVEKEINTVLTNAFAFGGNNSSLIFSKINQ